MALTSTQKKVIGVGVVATLAAMAGIGLWARQAYVSAKKAYAVALEAIAPAERCTYEYSELCKQVQWKYVWASCQRQQSFDQFWTDLNPEKLGELQQAAAGVGLDLEQARNQIVWGTFPRVSPNYPVDHSRDYFVYGVCGGAAVISVGVGATAIFAIPALAATTEGLIGGC